jgi:hypothetical protein
MARLIRSLPLTLAWGAVVLASSAALGQPAPASQVPPLTERITMHLDYHGVPGCSDPEPFTLALTPRVHGWDPLAPEASWRLVVTVTRRGKGYEGVTELYDPKGGPPWTRRVPMKLKCFDVLDTLAVIVSFHVDPPDAPPPPPMPPASPSEPEPAKPPQAPAEPPLAPAEPPFAPAPEAAKSLLAVTPPVPDSGQIRPTLDAGAWVDLGLAPRPLLGVKVDAGLRRAQLSLTGEFRWDPRASAPLPGNGEATTMLVVGGLAGCVHHEWYASFAGCLVSELGQLQRSAGALHLVGPRQEALYAGTGAGVHVKIPLPARLYAKATANLLGARRLGDISGSGTATMTTTAGSVWSATGGFGASVGLSF